MRIKQSDGRYALRLLGLADDHANSDGSTILSFAEAQRRATTLENQVKLEGGLVVRPATVAEAAETYLSWFKEHRKSVNETASVIRAHILPKLGLRPVAELRASELRAWHNKLAEQPARVRSARFGKPQKFKRTPQTEEQRRARRSTANRILNVLKAILNRAFQDGLAPDDREWRRVLPFPNADQARIRFLTDAEAIRLLNRCPMDLRRLVKAALLTGARYSELINLRGRDVNLQNRQVYFALSKSGRSRYVPLNPEGVAFFAEAIGGRRDDALVFTRSDGRGWGKNHHVRLLRAACSDDAAKISPPISFHELRHTYGSALARAGVDLLTISKLLGHADTRITAKHYAHLNDSTLASAVLKLPSVEPSRLSLLTPVPVQVVSTKECRRTTHDETPAKDDCDQNRRKKAPI